MAALYAQIILPLSLHGAYTYAVPDSQKHCVAIGKRVIVQFGAKRLYAGLITEITTDCNNEVGIKEIIEVLDADPVVLPKNLNLWKWIADYYCCTLGDVLRAALPSGLKLESKSSVSLIRQPETIFLNEQEEEVVCMLKNGPVFISELQKLQNQFSYATLKSLHDKKLIEIEEKVTKKYRPKTETFVKFHADITSEAALENQAKKLSRAKKQQALLYHFCFKTNAFEKDHIPSISKKELLDGTGFSTALVKALCEKNILVQFPVTVSRLEDVESEQVELNLLNFYQQQALTQIKTAFQSKQVALIHGITASGKTEIYIHLIDETIKAGLQALYLVPEIALTTQTIRRLKSVFGNKVGIYHSRLSNSERVEIWEKTLLFRENPSQGYQVILGARSAILLPFSNLGLIVVDEEHETSYKQFDPAPRYHARDTAIFAAHQANAKVLLGSATPSAESYYNALIGKYALVNLWKKHANIEPPEIIITNMLKAYKKKQMHGMLTPELYKNINTALENHEQVILFQNRRGYSSYIECFSCGWVPKCKQCDVSLTYHKYKKRLTCHYCGYSFPFPSQCHDCGSPEVKTRGFGTEQIEEELKLLFRNACIDRMDMDTTQSKNAFDKIVGKLEHQKTDILTGTQMVAKGLDFEHVSVVGILNADNLINFPDFRAHERACQLIAQVSGRAGRKHRRGKVVVQTSQPDHHIFQFVRNNDYTAFLNSQLNERKLFSYPPFFRLIKLIVKHKNAANVDRVSLTLANKLRKNSTLTVLGPEYPLISRVKLWYNKEIWLKMDKKLPLSATKKFILQTIEETKKLPSNSSCTIYADVDPY